jgi:GT2 family glycosyltransferase
MKNKLVSIIIVNWNGKEVLKDCLETLRKIDYPNWELIIVDNGSSDGSEAIFGKAKVIKNSKNLGFATANNQGFKESKGEYILLLNNDTKVTKSFLSKMVDRMESDRSIGAMQPKIKLMDKPEYLDNCGSLMTQTGLLKHTGFLEKDNGQFNNVQEVFSAKGACLLTRREVIEKIGLFDNTFGSYFEESDFCFRVWLAGWRVLYFPVTIIYHKLGFTSKNLSPVDVNFHSTKNRIASYIKNMEVKNIFTLLIYHLLIIKGLGIYYLLKFQFRKSMMMFIKTKIKNTKNAQSLG